MTKPMYCPMSFSHEIDDFTRRCTPDCAWAIKDRGKYGCAAAVIARASTGREAEMNNRPLKDDAE